MMQTRFSPRAEANVVVYPNLGLRRPYGFDCNWFRLGGVGLGNLLITWARAEVLTARIGARMLAPTFVQICPGPIRRMEKDWRTYFGMFRHDPAHIRGVHRVWSLLRRPRVDEAAIDSIKDNTNAICIEVEGIAGLFAPLAEHREFVRLRLKQIISSKYYYPTERRKGVIGLHVRTGDFRMLGWETAVGWFTEQILVLRKRWEINSVELYTDDNSGEVVSAIRKVVVGLCFSDQSSQPAVTSILRLASCEYLIGSNRSTFSMWAAYLGDGYVAFPDTSELLKSGLSCVVEGRMDPGTER